MKIIVAMSGGVDSAVSAALLKEQGHEVEGVFMKNWSPETVQSLTDCPWEQDQNDAAAVCEKLAIPFRSINFEKEYKERVVDYFVREYALGRTPNPDVMCNKEIKFAAFLRAAEDLGAEKIATGHYAQLEEVGGRFWLKRGVDPGKDQSYFLYTLTQAQLSKSIFPVGGLQKTEVRQLAERFELPNATKKDSQGICFIGHIDLKKFLTEQIMAKPGGTYLLPSDTSTSLEYRKQRAPFVGRHQGVMFYTLGERAGAIVDNGLYRHIRDGADVPSLYVLAKDVERNILYVTERHDDPHFYARELHIEAWQPEEIQTSLSLIDPNLPLTMQVRYHDRDAKSVKIRADDPVTLEVEDDRGCWAVTPGQSAVVYNGDRLLGGGVVSSAV